MPVFEGDDLWLPGGCAHLTDEMPARALGCVERVAAADGRQRARVWIAVPEPEAPQVNARALGITESGAFLWANDTDVWQIERGSGAATRVARDAPLLAAALASGLPASAPLRRPLDGPVDLGLAGPVLSEPVLAWVSDGALEARHSSDGRAAWTAEGRYAYVPGSLVAVGDNLLAVALDRGISPARLDAVTGRRLERGFRFFAGNTVLAAAFIPPNQGDRPALATVVRLSSSLRDDALVLFGRDGDLAGTWLLPDPQRPRHEPPGLAADAGGVYVFYDGRFVARLSVPD